MGAAGAVRGRRWRGRWVADGMWEETCLWRSKQQPTASAEHSQRASAGGGTRRAVPAPRSCAEGIDWVGRCRCSVRPLHLPRAERTQSPHWVAMQAQIPGQEMWGASVEANDIHQRPRGTPQKREPAGSEGAQLCTWTVLRDRIQSCGQGQCSNECSRDGQHRQPEPIEVRKKWRPSEFLQVDSQAVILNTVMLCQL